VTQLGGSQHRRDGGDARGDDAIDASATGTDPPCAIDLMP
jgi:hypothetical protein